MPTQRLSILSVAALTAAGALLAGCRTAPVTSGAPPAAMTQQPAASAAAPSAAADTVAARDALRAAVNHMSNTIYRYTGGQNDLTTRGHADPVHKSASMAARGSMQGVPFTQEVIAVGTNYWVRLNMGAKLNATLGVQVGKWMHIDSAKLGAGANLPFDLARPDVLDLAGLLGAITEARRTDANDYAGTVDMSTAVGVSAFTQENLDKLGDKAKAMPFTATLDAQGRLTDFIVDGSAVDKALGARFMFSDFGVAFPIKPPVNGVVEAPPSIYNLFKN